MGPVAEGQLDALPAGPGRRVARGGRKRSRSGVRSAATCRGWRREPCAAGGGMLACGRDGAGRRCAPAPRSAPPPVKAAATWLWPAAWRRRGTAQSRPCHRCASPPAPGSRPGGRAQQFKGGGQGRVDGAERRAGHQRLRTVATPKLPPPLAGAHLQAYKGGDACRQQAPQLRLANIAAAAAAGLHEWVAAQQQAARDEPVGKVGKGACLLVVAWAAEGGTQRVERMERESDSGRRKRGQGCRRAPSGDANSGSGSAWGGAAAAAGGATSTMAACARGSGWRKAAASRAGRVAAPAGARLLLPPPLLRGRSRRQGPRHAPQLLRGAPLRRAAGGDGRRARRGLAACTCWGSCDAARWVWRGGGAGGDGRRPSKSPPYPLNPRECRPARPIARPTPPPAASPPQHAAPAAHSRCRPSSPPSRWPPGPSCSGVSAWGAPPAPQTRPGARARGMGSRRAAIAPPQIAAGRNVVARRLAPPAAPLSPRPTPGPPCAPWLQPRSPAARWSCARRRRRRRPRAAPKPVVGPKRGATVSSQKVARRQRRGVLGCASATAA